MGDKKDSFGNRIKENYENRSRFYLIRRTPVIIRCDGAAFHTLTSGLEPFDKHFIGAMKSAVLDTSDKMQGFKLAYVQSDEVSFLLTDFDKLATEAWFDYNLNKILSISASMMSASFSDHFGSEGYFDARAFNIPKDEVANYFLWRMKDWKRNSLMMYCRSFFSHRQLMNKGQKEQHEMLHSIGKNWAEDLKDYEKNGALILREKTICDFTCNFGFINSIVDPLLKEDVVV